MRTDMSATPTTGRSEFAAGWRVLLAALLGTACGASPIPFNTIGFLMGPINAEFGWSFLAISLGVTIYGIVASLLAPVYGGLADRYGVRPVALWSLFAFALAFAAFALTPANIAGFYAIWLLVGLVGIGSTPVTWSRAINMWFFRNRGLALGIMLLGTSLAAVVLPRLTVHLIETVGWRLTHPLIALLPLLVGLPVAYLFFREPRPEERPAAGQAAGTVDGATLGQAIRDYRFWVIWASILLVALAYGGAHLHMPEILKGHGFTPADAAGVMGVIAISIFAGRIVTGALLDRFWAPIVCFPILCLPALSCWLLAESGVTSTSAILAAAFLGFAAGAESDLIAYLASRYFGMAHYGKIYGMLYMPFGLASAISPALYGWVRDATGGYDPMLYAAMGLFVGGGALLLTLGRYPEKRSTAVPEAGLAAEA